MLVEHRRERALEANAVARSLLAFKLEHNGNPPKFLNELSFGVNGNELSSCRLLPLGTRNGLRAVDVSIEVDGYRETNMLAKWILNDDGHYVIRIYSDNRVCAESSVTKF